MMTKRFLYITLLLGLFLTSCSDHLVSDAKKRKEIKEKFEQRKEQFLKNRQEQLLDVFSSDISIKEREALEFLYAYETLSDLSNYDSDYYLQQIRYAFKAQNTFHWGKKVSKEDFLHFVLPPRAGTENMDSARLVIFKELKERVRHMSMKDAALEVNHWCHEKVTYTGTDGRTSAPLATIKNAKGRCGEESVLTVTALRAVGIPARQIYTPRWVHQDDNHAWVEFWADGEWYFMGACEPEADVNQGWFVEPSRRAILTATQTPGHYETSDLIYKRENYTRLNQVENYATAKNLFVKVLDRNRKPIEKANVGFLVCNYAELYHLADLQTDENGLCKLKLGLGDVLVWTWKENKFNFEKVSVADTDTLSIELSGSDFSERIVDVDLIPPVKKAPFKVSAEGKAKNKERLVYEDSIRLAYENTFMAKEKAIELAKAERLDTSEVWQKIKASRGNWESIQNVITKTPTDRKMWILPLLQHISEKDLRDAKAEVLLSHMNNTIEYKGQYSEDEYVQYVLNPRIAMEQLSAYKAYLKPKFKNDFWGDILEDPGKAEDWILENISINERENYIWVPATPKGVFEMKTSDLGSAKILFVAMCRTAGVVARIDKVTGIAQYKIGKDWTNVYLGKLQPKEIEDFGSIQLKATESSKDACEYYKNFTLAKFENGSYKTLEFEFKKALADFPAKLKLASGNYMLYTAERVKDGNLLTRLSFFNLSKDEHKEIDVRLRKEEKALESLGSFFLPSELKTVDGQIEQLDSESMRNGIAVIWLDPDKEPTKHVLKDFVDLKQSFDDLQTPFVFVLPNDDRAKVFNKDDYNLPENSIFVTNDQLLQDFESATKQSFENQFPVLTMISANKEIFYISNGYKIGAGDQLLKVFKKYQE
jgi:transglutaminase-like putative cysteine protease